MEGKIKIRKNDTVEVIAGSEKGKRGAVLRVLPEKNQVIIQGVNMGKKAMRKRSQQDQGGIAVRKAAYPALDIRWTAIKKCVFAVRVEKYYNEQLCATA